MIKRGFKCLRVERDFRSAHFFRSDGLYNQVPSLTDMPWLTKCSFFVHKSIDYLDLCLHENSYLTAVGMDESRLFKSIKYPFFVRKSKDYVDLCMHENSYLTAEKGMDASLLFNSNKHPLYNKFVNTQEKFRKAMIPDRRVLYTFHLDPPIDRESSFKVVTDPDCLTMDPQSIFCDTIYMTDFDYKKSIREFVQLSFEQSNIETKRMRGLLRLMKHAVSCDFPLRCVERDRIFRVLLRKCTDSDVAREFISMHNLEQWFFCYYKTNYLDFIIRHARQTTFVLEVNQCAVEAINWLIACSKYRKNLEILLRYQNQPSFMDFDYSLIVEACVKQSKVGTYVKTKQLQVPVQERRMSKRRHFLLLQVLRVFFDRKRSVDKECLRILWRALPDSFFTSHQLMFTYEKIPHPMRVSLQDFYKGIVDEDISDSKPRSLQHYSRVAIRRILCRNKMLPEGIVQLGLAQAHQAYLRLEK